MPILKPDTSEAIEMTPIEAGTYKSKIIEAPIQQSKGEGGKAKLWMVVPKFEVLVNGKERTRKTYLVTEGEGAGGFDQLLRAVNMDELADQYKDPNVQPKPEFDTDTLIGQELNLIIDADLYQKRDASGNPVGSPELRDKIKGFLKI